MNIGFGPEDIGILIEALVFYQAKLRIVAIGNSEPPAEEYGKAHDLHVRLLVAQRMLHDEQSDGADEQSA
jgi:hypothetical protein